ncbi:MAG: transcription-repair coupling factor (superfamily II helicase) [Pseudohongiellaceae bacterium]|jgi:transcription-repair coupling factor (superfamily II helicase)
MQSLFDLSLPSDNYQSAYWSDAHGFAPTLAIFEAAMASDGPMLVVCQDNETVERFKRELAYFCKQHEGIEVFSLPDWETLPYDNFSPHQDIISDRLNALYHLPELTSGILVLSITSLMHKLPPHSYITANSLNLKVGQTLDLIEMRRQLSLSGYQAVESVVDHGEFTIRGSILDVFPMGSDHPFRIDLFGDEIETLRVFDPETQRSHDQVSEIRLLPAKEYPLDARGVTAFRSNFQEQFDIDLRQCPLYQDVSDGLNSPGLEYYLALFFTELNSLFDYLPQSTTLVRVGDLTRYGQAFWRDVETRYENRQIDRFRPVLKPAQVFVPVDSVLTELKQFKQIEFKAHSQSLSLETSPLPNFGANALSLQPFVEVKEFIDQHKPKILFCAESAGRRETLIELLRQADISPTVCNSWQDFLNSKESCLITVAPLDQGLWLPKRNLVAISESQLFGDRVAQRRRRKRTVSNTEFLIKSLTELRLNDAVVHSDHGVGRYRGLETIVTDGQANEFLMLEYASNAKLYVPVASLHLISRYGGADQDSAPLNSLGNDQWRKLKRKAAEKIRDVAVELLDIYARRQAKKGVSYVVDQLEFEKFSASFPFEETADQETAIEAVVNDMKDDLSMDRLVCGDVGFGKTEVAMRAAFIAVSNNKQVAILVPTTLLAQQHYESFKDRFADWPFVVEVVSRFKTSSQQDAVLEQVRQGKVDILIGTHKLLHGSVVYKDLGLLIIDEEHRFGVRQKEKLKSLRANVDILTLTATPIPRTLNMALSDIRDLSLIVTPPAKRLSVKTFVRESQDSLVNEAVSRELLRGGQVFYLHNEVKTIARAAEHLHALIPQARVAVAHGQMAEKDLEKVMADFYHKRYNILVCTTIIETGIDIPSANTIVIQRADKFGLAQLHQLRGRVGRSHHQAYAYLLTPRVSEMSADAQKRIEAIQAASALGAGFTLASHDLEIRGAGELLGDEQSGHMQKIGYSLYTEMLEEAVAAIKSGKSPDISLDHDKSIDINLRIPALIPEEYLPDVHTRLIMYKRLASAKTRDELEDLQVEMIDRFGLFPEPLKRLISVTALKLDAQRYGIRKIDANVRTGRIEFAPDTCVDPMSLVTLIQTESLTYKLTGANQLSFNHDCEDPQDKLDFINQVLGKLKLSQKAA